MAEEIAREQEDSPDAGGLRGENRDLTPGEQAAVGAALQYQERSEREKRRTLAAAAREKPEPLPGQSPEDHAAAVKRWEELQREAAAIRGEEWPPEEETVQQETEADRRSAIGKLINRIREL